MASKALINFYARLLNKDQMKIEDVDEKLRDSVLEAQKELFGETSDETTSNE